MVSLLCQKLSGKTWEDAIIASLPSRKVDLAREWEEKDEIARSAKEE